MIQKPASSSFVSTKGPSVTIASSPQLSITVALLGDARPPAKTHSHQQHDPQRFLDHAGHLVPAVSTVACPSRRSTLPTDS